MKRLLILLAALLPLAALVPPASAATAPAGGGGESACTKVARPHIPGARILSVTATARPGGTFTFPPNPPNPTPLPVTGVPAYCDITVILTHPGAHDRVRIQLWLPLTGWNGRFQATGGGFAAGQFERALAPAVKNGYATASTDAGVSTSGTNPPAGPWTRTGRSTRDYWSTSLSARCTR
jgi:hypothetical protein